MKHKVLYIALVVLGLAVAIPLATGALAQTPTPTPTPAAQTPVVPPNTVGPRIGGGMMGGGMMRGGIGMGTLGDWQTLKRVSTLLKLTPEELYTQLQGGQTLAQIAQTQGVSLDSLAATILAPTKDQLQLRVNYGYITQEQADYTMFVRTQELKKQLEKPLPTGLRGTTGRAGRGMMGPTGNTGQSNGSGAMMGPQGMGGGTTGGGMMGGGMMGGYGSGY